jgi:hypothetical protein
VTLERLIPNPGSDEAIERGCICPVLDNSHGLGCGEIDGRPVFVFDIACVLHWKGNWLDREPHS